MACLNSLSFLMIQLMVVLTWISLTYSFTSGTCKACAEWDIFNYYPYNVSCDTPKEMDCAMDESALKPYRCLVDHEADPKTGELTGKIMRSVCNYKENHTSGCVLEPGSISYYECICDEPMCDGSQNGDLDKVVQLKTKRIEKEVENKNVKPSCVPSSMMGSTSWTTGFTLAVVLMKNLWRLE